MTDKRVSRCHAEIELSDGKLTVLPVSQVSNRIRAEYYSSPVRAASCTCRPDFIVQWSNPLKNLPPPTSAFTDETIHNG